MYYIVRVYGDGCSFDEEFQDLDEAASYMASLNCHCELYAWLAGVEKYMGDNGVRCVNVNENLSHVLTNI